jgi:hypothetical protein
MVESGTLLADMLGLADEKDEVDVRFITMVFGSLILAAATQGMLITRAIARIADFI